MVETVKRFVNESRLGKKEEKQTAIDNFNTNFEESTIKNRQIGDFINKKILGNAECEPFRTFRKESGTLSKNKAKFARIATNQMESISDMSQDAKDLCEKIYRFILKSNGKE